MDERVFTRLSDWLCQQPVVLASVIATRGAVPRRAGSRMLIAGDRCAFSVGGGQAEAKVIDAAQALLRGAGRARELVVDLSGGVDSSGVCGGSMQLALRRWNGSIDQRRAQQIADRLAEGWAVPLDAADLGCDAQQTAQPNDRLLIIGAGHCGQALFELARHLDFDIWVFDPRDDCFASGAYAGASCLSGDFAVLDGALQSDRLLYVALLNRDYASDVATLRQLCQHAPPRYLGMMGSARRIHEVERELPALRVQLPGLQAPIGIELGAETPHEIAVSILAQMIAVRRSQTVDLG